MSNLELNIMPDLSHNKSVYYVLPLVGLSKFSFGGGDNFINSFVSYNGKVIAVIKDKELAEEFIKHTLYCTDFQVPDTEHTAIVFTVSKEFENDLSLFLSGKYSQMSESAKAMIRKYSGLPYRNTVPGSSTIVTHKLLMVLDKNASLRKWMENLMEITIDPDQELLEKPAYDKEFMDIDTILI